MYSFMKFNHREDITLIVVTTFYVSRAFKRLGLVLYESPAHRRSTSTGHVWDALLVVGQMHIHVLIGFAAADA
jgi:hypothetical protein